MRTWCLVFVLLIALFRYAGWGLDWIGLNIEEVMQGRVGFMIEGFGVDRWGQGGMGIGLRMGGMMTIIRVYAWRRRAGRMTSWMYGEGGVRRQ